MDSFPLRYHPAPLLFTLWAICALSLCSPTAPTPHTPQLTSLGIYTMKLAPGELAARWGGGGGGGGCIARPTVKSNACKLLKS